MAQAHKKHEHSNEFFFIVRQLEDFFPLNLHFVSASYLFLTIFLSSVLHLSFMTPSIFSPYYYTCFFFSQGILQAHATMDSSLSLCSPTSLLICLFSSVFSICFSILIFLHLGLSYLNFRFYFSLILLLLLFPLLWIILICFFSYGYIFPPTFYLVLSVFHLF